MDKHQPDPDGTRYALRHGIISYNSGRTGANSADLINAIPAIAIRVQNTIEGFGKQLVRKAGE